MRVLLVLVASFALLAGCAAPTEPTPSDSSPGGTTPTGTSGSPTPTGGSDTLDYNATFVLIRNEYWVNESGPGRAGSYVYADTGPHCSDTSYSTNPARVQTTYYGSAAPPSYSFILVRHFDNETVQPFSTTSGSPSGKLHIGKTGASFSVALTSPFNRTNVLAQVLSQNGEISIEGEVLPVGGDWTGRYEYTEADQQHTYAITEIFRAHNYGRTPVHAVSSSIECI